MAEPTLKQIRMFLAVARHRSFRVAGDRVSASQSSISIQIKQLEDRVGLALFDRTTRVVKLTPAGSELLADFERLAAMADEVRVKCAQLAAGRTGQLRIGVLPSIAEHLLPEVIAEFSRELPGVHFEIFEAVEQELIAAVKVGRCDLGLTSARMLERGMTFEGLFSDDLFAVMLSSHPLASLDEIPIAALAERPLILTKWGTSLRLAASQAFEDEGIAIVPAYEVTNMATALGFAAKGLGVALLPASAVRNMQNVATVARPLRGQAGSRMMGILQLEGAVSYPLQQRFIALLRSVVATAASRQVLAPES
ncbi:LysR family transcriptional regulator [Rhodopseudomonas palustris]|nr:LysR family transcriptional regulator [Rhodopseudomonas palustris]